MYALYYVLKYINFCNDAVLFNAKFFFLRLQRWEKKKKNNFEKEKLFNSVDALGTW